MIALLGTLVGVRVQVSVMLWLLRLVNKSLNCYERPQQPTREYAT